MAINREYAGDLGRIPCRPLSFANLSMAQPKELVVDYANGNLYINDENGVLHEVSQMIINEVINQIQEGDIINVDASTINITVTVPGEPTVDPDTGAEIPGEIVEQVYNLEEFAQYIMSLIKDHDSKISQLFESYESVETFIQNIIITDEEGNVIINAGSIQEDETHRFVTDEQISNWDNKATHQMIYAIIGTTWVGDAAPYTQIVNISGINQNDSPLVDVKLDDAMGYDDSMAYLNLFSNIYRITTHDGYITVYSSEAIETPVPIMMKVIR